MWVNRIRQPHYTQETYYMSVWSNGSPRQNWRVINPIGPKTITSWKSTRLCVSLRTLWLRVNLHQVCCPDKLYSRTRDNPIIVNVTLTIGSCGYGLPFQWNTSQYNCSAFTQSRNSSSTFKLWIFIPGYFPNKVLKIIVLKIAPQTLLYQKFYISLKHFKNFSR